MKNILQKISHAVGSGAGAAWKYLSGKKRLIAIACGLISQIIPQHTAVGQSATWLQNNLDYITIGLEITSGLFGATALVEHGAVKIKNGYEADTLPGGLTKILDKIPDKITGVKGSKNLSASGGFPSGLSEREDRNEP